MLAQIIGAWQRALSFGMRLAANEPDDGNAEGDGDGTGHAQRRFRSAGAGLEQLSSEARKERPQQPFDHENKAKGNDEIAHGAAGKGLLSRRRLPTSLPCGRGFRRRTASLERRAGLGRGRGRSLRRGLGLGGRGGMFPGLCAWGHLT